MQFKYKKLQYRNINKEVDEIIARLSILGALFGVISILILILSISLYANWRLTHRIIEAISTQQIHTNVSDDFYANLDPCVLSDVECN